MYIKKTFRMSKIHHTSGAGGGGGGVGGGGASGTGGGHSNASFVPDEQVFANSADKKKFAIEMNEKNVEYDPYHHRTVKHPTTNTETLIHLLKGSLGTGE